MNLSSSAQALYLHLNMSADDDGFCNQVSICMFKAHASVQDLQSLLERRYIYQFENGVIVIKHWRMANALRKDRYTPTAFKEELSRLRIKDNGSYTMVANGLPDGCQMVADCLPQDRLDKDSLDKVNKKEIKERKFRPPTLEEVKAYCTERNNAVDPQHFIDYYTANGWKVGKNSMKDWKAAVRTWESNGYGGKKKKAACKDYKPVDLGDLEGALKKL
jgi:hypothetical protein